MEDQRVAAEAQRAADQLAWHKTLNERFESFAKNLASQQATESDPIESDPTESNLGPS